MYIQQLEDVTGIVSAREVYKPFTVIEIFHHNIFVSVQIRPLAKLNKLVRAETSLRSFLIPIIIVHNSS